MYCALLRTLNSYTTAVNQPRYFNAELIISNGEVGYRVPHLNSCISLLMSHENAITAFEPNKGYMFVLLGFKVALTSEVISGQCLLVAVDQCTATMERHAEDTGHDTPSCHSIQAMGLPVVALSIGVVCYTGSHSY